MDQIFIACWQVWGLIKLSVHLTDGWLGQSAARVAQPIKCWPWFPWEEQTPIYRDNVDIISLNHLSNVERIPLNQNRLISKYDHAEIYIFDYNTQTQQVVSIVWK